MDCLTCSEGLTAYLDGELEQQERELIQQHLETCPDCSAEYESSLYASHLIDRLLTIDPDPNLWQGISSELGRSDWSLQRLHMVLFGRWRPVMAAAGLGALFLGLSLFFPSEEQVSPKAEKLLQSFLQERERLHHIQAVSYEEQSNSFPVPLHPNPFAEAQQEPERNPFASE